MPASRAKGGANDSTLLLILSPALLLLVKGACFGLRFRLKRMPAQEHDEYRWLELERPLSKQLEKSAAEVPHVLHFDVMFYTREIGLLSDPVAR